MICPNCKKENKDTNISCEFCLTQLIDTSEYNNQTIFSTNNNVETKEIQVSKNKVGCIVTILFLFFAGTPLIVGLGFLGGGLFSSISEYNQTKGYEKTTAVLKDYDNCYYENGSELCDAVYEYEVNGITYTVSPKESKDRSRFDATGTVYYNPDKPSESVMYANWTILIVVGFIIVSVIIVIFFAIKKFLKKILKGKDNLTMYVYKTK